MSTDARQANWLWLPEARSAEGSWLGTCVADAGPSRFCGSSPVSADAREAGREAAVEQPFSPQPGAGPVSTDARQAELVVAVCRGAER